MKRLQMLVLFIVISATISNSVTMEQNGGNNAPANRTISLDQRRLSIFPKNHMRFTVSPLTYENKAKTIVTEEIATKKPVMAKFIPKSKILSDVKNTATTRRPLMKLRTYTVTMRSKVRVETMDKDRSHNKRNSKKEESSEETTEKNPTALQTPEFTEFENKSVDDQDHNEFIFLKSNKEKVPIDMIDNSEEDIETTTRIPNKRARRKRSSNIIEEENMGTTISGLKYTDRDTKLNNNLYFKNINSR